MMILKDNFNRIHNYLRFSVIDNCNLACTYCNPRSKITKLSKDHILTFEEIERLSSIFVSSFGITKIRITGGEPLVRKDLPLLLSNISRLKKTHPFELNITTNGILLEQNIEKLKTAGVDRINISLDSLDPLIFKSITGADSLNKVLRSIDTAIAFNFSPKINVVIMKGINDHEIIPFVNFAVSKNINIRFIEYMPFDSNSWHKDKFLGIAGIKSVVENYHPLTLIENSDNSVAKDYSLNGTNAYVSFISSISDHFCSSCNRLRITAAGNLKLCLFTPNDKTINLKDLLRNPSITDSEIEKTIINALSVKELKHPGINELLNNNSGSMMEIGG